MDIRQLAHTTAVLISAYLPFLWHNNLPESEDWRRKEAITKLWDVLQPELGAALQTAIIAAEQPSEATLLALSNLLANLFSVNTELEKRVDNILSNGPFAVTLAFLNANSSPTLLKQQADEWRQRIMRPVSSRAPGQVVAENEDIPACQVCKRQDASLRIVVFPFVVSLIFVTFRRAFSGLWCRRHAGMRQVLATLITATVGWLGIPFGLLYTPMALLTLARGGDQPGNLNQRMLMALARHKQQADNDPREAMRCLESALEFGFDPTIEAELRSLYQRYEGPHYGGGYQQIARFLFTLLGVYVAGMIAGIADAFISGFISGILGEETFLMIALLSWTPFVALTVTAWLILLQLVESTLRQARIRHKSLAVVLAALASLLTIYGIPTGTVLAMTLTDASLLVKTFSSLPSALFSLGWIFTRGGVTLIGEHIASGTTPDFIYLIILLVMLALYLVSTNQRAKIVTTGYQRIDEIHDRVTSSRRRTPATGWLSILAVVLLFGGLLAATGMPWLTMVSYGDPAAMELFGQGMGLLEEGNIAEARADFEEARAIDPDSFAPYLGLGYVEMLLDNCKEAQAHLETARDLAPPDMQTSAMRGLGAAYRCSYQADASIAALEDSLALDPSLIDTHEDIAIGYMMKGDFETAVEHLTLLTESSEASASPYAYLAIAYYILGQPEQADLAIDQSLEHVVETDEYLNIASYYYYVRDYHDAETYLKRGLESSPPAVSNLSVLAYANIYQGDFDEALQIADRILAMDGQNGEAFAIQSTTHEEQGDLKAAREAVEKGLALDPDNETLLVQLAYIAFEEKDYGAAAEQAQASISRSPYYGSAYRLLALSEMESGSLDEAMTTAKKALELMPKDDLPYYVVGVCYMQAGNKTKAAEAFETFLSLAWKRRLSRGYQQQAEDFLAELRP